MKIGKRVRAQVEILDGISAGDTIVVTGHQKIRPGSTVRDVNAPAGGGAATGP